MVCKIDDRFLVACREIFDLQFVLRSYRVNNADCQVSRVPFFHILAEISEFESVYHNGRNIPRSPNHLVKSLQSTVDMILAIVARERIRDFAQRELSPSDSIRITAENCPEVCGIGQISVQGVV